MKKSNIIKNWPRYVLQWGVLIGLILVLGGIIKTEAADPETYCPMGGLQAFATYLVRGSLPCSMSSVQIMMGLCLAAFVVLFSKLFCGYLCPVGTIEDLLRKLRKSIGLKNINIPSRSFADLALRIIKYVLLFYIFYLTCTASELWCKNLDPYYAVATGFKGEITLWMSITTLVLVVLGGILVDNFWCRYICPLGAACSSFKFWICALVLFGFWFVLQLCGVNMPWWVLLGAFCLIGYIGELFAPNTRFQLVNVYRNDRCNGCHACDRACPNHINVYEITNANNGKLACVDCTMCGECIAACNRDALHVGVTRKGRKNIFNFLLPALLAIVMVCLGLYLGNRHELPTINEEWGIYSNDSLHTQLVDPATLETVTIEGLKQIHCFGSSMAFKGRLETIKGVHGVKTYVKSHKADIKYDPAKTSAEKIQEEIYVPSKFKCSTPDYKEIPELKVITIRTEHMPAPTDLNMLGIQFKQVDSLIYGLESEWDCPLIVRMYVDPAFDKDEEWIASVVNKPTLDFTRPDGSVKKTPLGYEFVRMEKRTSTIKTTDFLERMFSRPFTAEFQSRIDAAEGKPQYIYEIADENFTKPIISRNLPFVSNHLSRNEGIISVCTRLNKDYIPSLQIRYFAPMTADKIWELLTMEEWTITYTKEDVRIVPAKILFKKPGIIILL